MFRLLLVIVVATIDVCVSVSVCMCVCVFMCIWMAKYIYTDNRLLYTQTLDIVIQGKTGSKRERERERERHNPLPMYTSVKYSLLKHFNCKVDVLLLLLLLLQCLVNSTSDWLPHHQVNFTLRPFVNLFTQIMQCSIRCNEFFLTTCDSKWRWLGEWSDQC